jgi:hypothetical protein
MTYTLDSLHPDRLRCDRCGAGFPVTLPAGTDPGDVACLTEDEASDLFAVLALELRLHGYLCSGAWLATHEEWQAMAPPR